MSSARPPAPPGGTPPPRTATVRATGAVLDLEAIAIAACRRYREEYPDEADRYGEVGMAWCVHDTQHLVNWAVMDLNADVVLNEQVAWLARVLEARDFPLDRLARSLDIDAEVVADAPEVAARLRDAAALVRERGSFLG